MERAYLWFSVLPVWAQFAIGAAAVLFLIRILSFVFPRRVEHIDRKVRGEGPGTWVRTLVILTLLCVGGMWLFGLYPFDQWWDGTQRPASPVRWVPWVVPEEDPVQVPCPVCPHCGGRHP